MKILKEKSREYKGQNYFKYKVNLPATILSQSKLKAGDELDVECKNEMLILKKRRDSGAK